MPSRASPPKADLLDDAGPGCRELRAYLGAVLDQVVDEGVAGGRDLVARLAAAQDDLGN